MLEYDAALVRERDGLLLITDKGFASRDFEQSLSADGITLLRPSRKDEVLRPGEPVLKKVRQLIESVNDTLKGQLDLEHHGGRTFEGVAVRVAQRILALTQRSGATSTPDRTPAAPPSPTTTKRNQAG